MIRIEDNTFSELSGLYAFDGNVGLKKWGAKPPIQKMKRIAGPEWA